ncbi:MAG: alpha/beta fold hydrolase [Novosphingobium sp.]|nr:alpha/beta fold hydrolase [Novosphingobium sp.]
MSESRRTRRWFGFAAAAAGLALAAGGVAAQGPSLPNGAIAIAKQGSFEAGGHILGDAAKSLACDHGHVEYEIPVGAKKTALFLWHSSSAAVWQRRWDGGEGYQTKLLRAGYPTYVWDGPRVGRANWGCEDYTYHAQAGRDQGNFGAWRFGPAYPNFYPGEQFPVNDPDALEQANRARYDEFDSVANAQLQSDAAAKAIERIGPTVALTNSAGGMRALYTVLKTDKLKGIVAYENPGYVFPDTIEPKLKEGLFGPIYVPESEFMKFTKIPIQLVWGDHLEDSKVWVSSYAQAELFAKEVNKRGGHVEMLHLTDAGLHGNSHIPFADMNNDQVAKLLFQWLKKNNF